MLWNEFLYAVVLITEEDKRTLPLGIQKFMGDQLQDIGMISTGLMIAIVPVIVVYGYDNTCMLDAMARSGGRFKGVAMIPPEAADEELHSMKQQGVVGVRLHLMRSDPDALSRPGADQFLARIRALGWFVEVYATGQVWCGIERILRESDARLLIAHLGEPEPSSGVNQPGFQAVLKLGREADAVVKLSAPFRASAQPFPHADVDPFVAAVIDSFGLDRCVWGSDWPFINTSRRVEYGSLLRCLGRWLPAPEDRDRVLWRNPARLFGFADGT